MKTCITCYAALPLGAFGKNKTYTDGLMKQCRACNTEYHRQRRAKDPVEFLLVGVRSRAKREGIAFDITSADLYAPTHCPALGIKLNYEGTGRGYGAKDDAASIDRVDGAKGYVRGNVGIVSWKANRAKAFLSVRELRRLVTFYEQFE